MVRFLYSGNWNVNIPLRNEENILDFFKNDSNLSYEWYESFLLRKCFTIIYLFQTSPMGLALNEKKEDKEINEEINEGINDDEWLNNLTWDKREETIKFQGHFEHFYGDDAIKFFSYLAPFVDDFSFTFIKRDNWTGKEEKISIKNISGNFEMKKR